MRNARMCLLVGFAAILLVSGCAEEEKGPSGPNTGPLQSPTGGPGIQETPATAACPNEQDVVLNEGARSDEQDADMDGDGDDETVSVAKDELGIAGCKGFLVVDHGDSIVSIPVKDSLELDLGVPDIVGFASIDPFPGLDAIVRVNQGASTSFVAVYSLSLDSLFKSPFVDGPHPDGTFPYGGSVGHLDGVDCVDEGVVSSSATPVDDGYEVTRSFYVVGDGAMEFDEAATEVTSVSLDELESFPEFSGEPFDDCPT